MAQSINGRVIMVGNSVKLLKNPITEESSAEVIDFNENGYPVFRSTSGSIFSISAYMTNRYVECIS